MSDWTPAELELLRARKSDIGSCIADPVWGIAHFRDRHGSGGGGGFVYGFTGTAIWGRWHEWLEDAHRPDGIVLRWRKGAVLREARISYKRLQRWCEALPAEVRDRAVVHWRTFPVDSRDLDALDRLTLAVLGGDFDVAPLVPTQGALFELEGAL